MFATTSWFVGFVVLYDIWAIGVVLSIQSTVAVVAPTFPASSTNSNVKLPFSVNIYEFFPSLFVIVTFVLSKSIVAVTYWFVGLVVL